jgi:hypothetical protein
MDELSVTGIVYAAITAMSLIIVLSHWWRNGGFDQAKEFYGRFKTQASKAVAAYERLPQVAPRDPSGRRADRSGLAALRCVRGVWRAFRHRRGRRAAPPAPKEVALA